VIVADVISTLCLGALGFVIGWLLAGIVLK
jgi:hypothetical protein